MSIEKKDQINALTSLYAVERSDLSTIGAQLTGVAGLALTYLITVSFVLGHSHTKKMPLLWFAAPIPVLIFLAFYTLFLSLSIARTASCKRLEVQIAREIEIMADDIGTSVSDKVMDIISAPRWWQKGLIIAAYVPIFLGSLWLIAYIPIRVWYHTNTS